MFGEFFHVDRSITQNFFLKDDLDFEMFLFRFLGTSSKKKTDIFWTNLFYDVVFFRLKKRLDIYQESPEKSTSPSYIYLYYLYIYIDGGWFSTRFFVGKKCQVCEKIHRECIEPWSSLAFEKNHHMAATA